MNIPIAQPYMVPFTALQEVFSRASYILLASGVSFAFFAFAVWLPNVRLIVDTVGKGGVAVSAKLQLLINLLQGIGTNFTLLSATYTIIIALLFGINIAVTVYFIKKKRTNLAGGGVFAGIGGMGSGILGIGCAACGSFILSSILSVVGAAGVIALLPFKGREFAILSIGLLIVSITLMTRKISEPVVCKPQFSKS